MSKLEIDFSTIGTHGCSELVIDGLSYPETLVNCTEIEFVGGTFSKLKSLTIRNLKTNVKFTNVPIRLESISVTDCALLRDLDFINNLEDLRFLELGGVDYLTYINVGV